MAVAEREARLAHIHLRPSMDAHDVLPDLLVSAAADGSAVSVSRLAKLIAGLADAMRRARLAGLSDDANADRFSILSAAQVAVGAVLAANGDGTAMRFLIASLLAARGHRPEDGRGIPDGVFHPMGWG